jgi:hypothetical protein
MLTISESRFIGTSRMGKHLGNPQSRNLKQIKDCLAQKVFIVIPSGAKRSRGIYL